MCRFSPASIPANDPKPDGPWQIPVWLRRNNRVSLDVDLPRETPAWLSFLDHTGDAGILVRAPDLKELFARAAWGMFSLVTDVDAIRLVDIVDIELEAPDLFALMVRWLSELNYRHVTEHRLFGKFEIIDMNEEWLAGVVRGERLDPTRHQIFTEIKAVTFHGMRLERGGEGWEAQIIFDL
jgi:SHS2 domain-containing protein